MCIDDIDLTEIENELKQRSELLHFVTYTLTHTNLSEFQQCITPQLTYNNEIKPFAIIGNVTNICFVDWNKDFILVETLPT